MPRWKIQMPEELDWCGQPILPGGCYGGRIENIATLGQRPALAAAKQAQHHAVITDEDLAEIFGHGACTLTRAQAVCQGT
jgi:hypothetical protein